MTTFTIGCDPEVFVTKNGKVISAHGLVPGDKKEPFQVKGGAIQVDGMALEFNTDPIEMTQFDTGRDSLKFSRRVLGVMKQLRDRLPEGHALRIEPFFEFKKEYLDEQPECAKELGCDPDMNAYTKEFNSPPDGEVLFRTTAGHIHVGWDKNIPVDHPDHLDICAQTIKTLDAGFGILSVIMDDDTRRRELYGKAGAFRPKPYGVEYRTPSNFWLKNERRRRWAYYATSMSLQSLRNNYEEAPRKVFQSIFGENLEYSEELVQEIINESKKDFILEKMTPMKRQEGGYWAFASTPRWKEPLLHCVDPELKEF